MRTIAAVALLPVAVGLVLLALMPEAMPVPQPRIHDEFAHLLVADTVAHGRAVNPSHPLWPHFETMHVLSRPVYASAYPVGHGAVMGVWKAVAGSAWAGVVFEMALMCGAMVWMLQGWVSPRWALIGGLLVAARFGVSSYWMNSYYGGALPAAAGAVVLGAAGRMLKRRRAIDAAVLCAGLAVLAHSRPYEGAIFGLGVGAMLLWRLRGRLLRREVLVPSIAVLGVAGAATMLWFAQYTGKPLTMPYEYFRSNFTEAPHFWFQGVKPEREYVHWVLRDFYHNNEPWVHLQARTNKSQAMKDKVKMYARFYAGPALGVAMLVALIAGWRRSRVRWLVGIGALVTLALLMEVWQAPHYAAPGMGAAMLFAVEGLRHLRVIFKDRRWGRGLVIAVCVASLALPVLRGGFDVGDGRARADVLARFQREGGKHLLIVRYGLQHDPGDEWVYNEADLEGAKVLWARELDAVSNRKLLDYYRDRRAWLIEPDARPVRATPYDAVAAAAWYARDARTQLTEGIGQYAPDCGKWDEYYFRVTGILPPKPERGCPPGPIDLDAYLRDLR